MSELDIREEVDSFLRDWQGNKIEEGDTIKFICYQKLKNPKSDEVINGENSFLIPEFFHIRQGAKAQTVRFNEGEAEYCFEELGAWKVETLDGTVNQLVIKVADLIMFGINSLIYMMRKWMPNCILAIEGKSDNETEFFTDYFML